MEKVNVVFLSLGSNLGERENTILRAIQEIQAGLGVVLKVSKYYYSPAEGFQSENEFCNVMLKLETVFGPLDLLKKLKNIEKSLGRKTPSQESTYEDRVIDIDIIFFNDSQFIDKQLIIPHPKWKDRSFVTIPLEEII